MHTPSKINVTLSSMSHLVYITLLGEMDGVTLSRLDCTIISGGPWPAASYASNLVASSLLVGKGKGPSANDSSDELGALEIKQELGEHAD